MTRRQIEPSAHIGDAAVALIRSSVSPMGRACRELDRDFARHGSIALRDPKAVVVSDRHIPTRSWASDRD